MNAPFLYVVSFAVNPAEAEPLLAWLDGGHCNEVASQPGFLFFRRVRLEQRSSDGWDRHMMIYGVESEKALYDYFANRELTERFSRERDVFEPNLRIERAWGHVEAGLNT
jgi:hypothetical protein